MNVQQTPAKGATAASRLAIADGDIHPSARSLDVLEPFLERRWLDHIRTFGTGPRHGFFSGPAYPKSQPGADRRDALPPEGGRAGSSLSFMQAQHLDPNNVAFGILNPLAPSGQGFRNLELGAAMTRAVNDWQAACWTEQDARLRASVVVAYEDADASVAEIRRRAGDRNFAQVLLLSRTGEPTGRRRYWPIFDAAVEAGLPVGIHAFGYGGHPITGGGWPSYYLEEMTGHAQASQAGLASLIFEGVFARHPTLKLVLIESGFAWLPSFSWRLDRLWTRMRAEVPHVKEPPSETISRQVWLTTQPMEEPGDPAHLAAVIDWIGWDRLIFATDYPHWDFDDPAHAMKLPLDAATRNRFYRENARAVWGF